MDIQISLGMKQRLAISPGDYGKSGSYYSGMKPMNGLDEEGTAEMRKLFLELKEKEN